MEVVRQQALEAGFEGTYDRSAFADVVAAPDPAFEAVVENEDCLALLVETGVTVAAVGVYDAPEREVRALHTAPAYQGNGFATALLDRFEERALADGADAVRVAAPRNAAPSSSGGASGGAATSTTADCLTSASRSHWIGRPDPRPGATAAGAVSPVRCTSTAAGSHFAGRHPNGPG